MVVRVLSFAGCPHVEQTVERVWAAIHAEGLAATVERVEVTGEAMARKLGFLGSPSVHVNGRDVEPEARDSKAVGFGCRTYLEAGVGEGKRTGVPSVAAIRSALKEGLEEARRAAHGDAAEAAVDSGAEG